MGETPSRSQDFPENTTDGRRAGTAEASGDLILSDREGFVGDTITLKGRNLPPGEKLDLYWRSSEGKWGVLKANEIVGPQYQPRTDHITTVESSPEGRINVEWTIPQDYGDEHVIELRDSGGQTLSKAMFKIRPWFDIDQTEAAHGETFRVVGYGLGPNYLTNNYQVTWDNGVVGFMTGVMNRGTAMADIRAVRPVGEHVIRVWRNYRNVPFLQNNTQSPFGSVGGDRQSSWTVTVTDRDAEPETMSMDTLMNEQPLEEHYPELDENTEATLEITPTAGQPGTDVIIRGRGFPEETEVDLVWYNHEGHVIKGISITAEPDYEMLPTVTTDEDGSFDVDFTIPNTLGATRPITAEVDGRSVAVTGFMVQPKPLDISPTEGPVGTEIEFEIAGIGWPNYENNYFFVYDNRTVGYVCGNDERDGIVRTKFEAVGEPGIHYIDVIPGLFDVEEDEPFFELRPHLSYVDNHPVRPLPAFHFTFEVTD